MDFDKILDEITSKIQQIPTSKKYWLIRTQSGNLYETFTDNNFVGLDHREVPLTTLENLRKSFKENNPLFQDAIKHAVILPYHILVN